MTPRKPQPKAGQQPVTEPPKFWNGTVQRNRIKLENWIDEQFDFLLQATALIVVYPIMRVLRYTEVGHSGFWDIMDKLHEIGAVLTFGLWIFGGVRRRLATEMKDE